MEFKGPTESQLDTIRQLSDLNSAMRQLVQDVATTGEGDWLGVADLLERVAERCRDEDRFAAEVRLLEERNTP